MKLTEASIDIGEELIKYERDTPPASNPESMRALGELDILTPPVAEEMAQAARFRNVLPHTYGQIINHDIVYNALQDLDRYRLFVQQISNYLDALGVLEND